MKKLVIIGPAHPLRGGLASFNERLAQAFQAEGYEVLLYTFCLQYPNFLFPGKTQYASDPKPQDLNIKVGLNSVNPFNWIKVGLEIRNMQPDMVICPFWLPFMGPCLGTVLRIIKSNRRTRILSVIHNIIPHEKRPGDWFFSKYFLGPVEGCIVMSKSVGEELQYFSKNIPVDYIPHPLYDNYGKKISRSTALKNLNLPPDQRYILFFGFIRDYKGLDLLIKAMPKVHASDKAIKLIIAGEFYSNEQDYLDLIQQHHLDDTIHLHTHFIPNDQVNNYFCAADLIVQPYKTATQSGISQIAYHFEKPMVVTNVGGLPEIVAHGEVGYVVHPDSNQIAEAILSFYGEDKADYFLSALKKRKQFFSWSNMVKGITNLLHVK